jgi:hypothetical protein
MEHFWRKNDNFPKLLAYEINSRFLTLFGRKDKYLKNLGYNRLKDKLFIDTIKAFLEFVFILSNYKVLFGG